ARRRPKQRTAAHKIRSLALDAARKADILRQSRAVGVGADVDVALFGAHDLERFDAVGYGGKIARLRPQALEQRFDVIGGDVDLVSQLAAETRPQHTQR